VGPKDILNWSPTSRKPHMPQSLNTHKFIHIVGNVEYVSTEVPVGREASHMLGTEKGTNLKQPTGEFMKEE